jgi:SMI1 / KNR4 family (SUKH-1)
LTDFIRSALDSGLASTAELHGISEAEVQAIEQRLSRRLPEVYRQFLLVFGRSESKFPLSTLPPLVWQCGTGVIDAFVGLRSAADRMLTKRPNDDARNRVPRTHAFDGERRAADRSRLKRRSAPRIKGTFFDFD